MRKIQHKEEAFLQWESEGVEDVVLLEVSSTVSVGPTGRTRRQVHLFVRNEVEMYEEGLVVNEYNQSWPELVYHGKPFWEEMEDRRGLRCGGIQTEYSGVIKKEGFPTVFHYLLDVCTTRRTYTHVLDISESEFWGLTEILTEGTYILRIRKDGE